jgi:hypothetical protein
MPKLTPAQQTELNQYIDQALAIINRTFIDRTLI